MVLVKVFANNTYINNFFQQVDCNGAGKGLCEQYGIHEVPTLKNFNKGVFTGDYTGPQTAGE